MIYATYQENNYRFTPQEIYVTQNNEEFPGNTRNYSTNNVPDSNQDSPSLIPVSMKRSQHLLVPITSKTKNCLPIYKGLRVKTVPEHGELYTE